MEYREAEELKSMLNQGMKAQLMRGDRDYLDCWRISIECIHRITDKINQMTRTSDEVCST